MDGYKRVGITGAGGFIGKRLAETLSGEYDLTLFFNKEKFQLKNSRYIVKDLLTCDERDFEGLDILIHLAGSSFDKGSELGYNLTKRVLECAIKAKVKEFLFASSYAIYGNRKTKARVESQLIPTDDYSLYKIFSEYLLKRANQAEEIKAVSLRFCSIYGDRGRGLIDVLKDKLGKGEKITLDSNFLRQYMYVDDLSNLILKILSDHNKKESYNFEGEKLSTQELSKMLISRGINCEFVNEPKKSYLCKGLRERSISVEEYLFPPSDAIN